MRLLPTIVLLAIAAALATAYLRLLGGTPSARDALVPEKPLVRIAAKDLHSITVHRPDGRIVLKPLKSVWYITDPVDDRLDPKAALALFLGLNGLVLYHVIPAESLGPEKPLESFGLGKKAVRVQISGASGSPIHSFEIGDTTSWTTDDHPTMYLQWKDGPAPDDILVAGGNLTELLGRPSDLWRARHGLHLPRPPVAILIRTGEAVMELRRDTPDSRWRMLRPITEDVEPSAVANLLATLSESEATTLSPRTSQPGFRGEATRIVIGMHGDPRPATMADLEGSVPVERGLGPIVAAFGKPDPDAPDEIWSRWSDRPHDLQVPASLLASLDPDPSRFRSRHLVVPSADDLVQIAVAQPGSGGDPSLIRRGHDGWEVFLRQSWVPADSNRVAQAVSDLSVAPILAVESDSPRQVDPNQSADPELRISLLDKNGIKIKLEIWRDGEFLRVIRSDRPTVYRLPAALLGSWPSRPSAWRARPLFRFSASDVTQLALLLPDRRVVLRHNPETNVWVALRNDKDATAHLDPTAATRLTASLEALTVARWTSENTGAILGRLSNPEASILITVTPWNPDDPHAGVARLRLSLVRAGPNSPFYYGKLDSDPDVFLIRVDTIASLTEGLFTDEE